MAFRIGRKHAYHTYPEPRAATTVPYARNSAVGPTDETPIAIGDGTTGGTAIPWSVLGVGSPGTNVPITPKSTGLIVISGVMTVQNNAEAAVQVQVQVAANGVRLPLPEAEQVTVEPNGGYVAIPLLAGGVGVVGTTSNVSVILSASVDDAIELIPGSSSLEIEEVQAPTG